MAKAKVKGSASTGRTDQDVGTLYWEDIEELLKLDQKYNRPNREGAFGAWEYDPETKTQKFRTTTEGSQAAMDRMDRRMQGEGFEAYKPPESTSAIRDAILQSRMERMNTSVPQQVAQPPTPPQPPAPPPRARPPVPPPSAQPPAPPPSAVLPPTNDPYPIKDFPPSQLDQFLSAYGRTS